MKVDRLVLNITSLLAKVLPVSFKKLIYHNETLSSIIRKRLNKYAPEGYNKVTIAAGINAGLDMMLNLQIEKDYWLGTYEPELQQTIDELVGPDQVIFDIGANVGFVSLMFAMKVGEGGHVYAFEALPENTRRLDQNIELNEYQSRVTVLQTAVQDHTGETEFLIGPSGAMGKVVGSSGRDSLDYPERIVVKALSIDQFIKEQGIPLPDIVKVDVEGGEALVLLGMHELLEQRRTIILLELHGSDSTQKCWKLLIESGYKICLMEPGFPQVKQLESLDWKSYIVGFPNDE